VIILDSFKIHILHARPKPDKDVKCPGVVPGVGKCPTPGGTGTAGIDWCISCESNIEEVSFEWSHHRISSTDSKVRITLMSPLTDSGSEGVKIKQQN